MTDTDTALFSQQAKWVTEHMGWILDVMTADIWNKKTLREKEEWIIQREHEHQNEHQNEHQRTLRSDQPLAKAGH